MPDLSPSYETRLNQDSRWAMSEGDRFFDEKSETHATLERICRRLNELKLPYSILGGMALFKHGFRRFTEDVDILIQKSDLKTIHQHLIGLGYVPLFEGSKNLRDTQSGVRIEFLLAGSYPGDGKEKPVSFPSPSDVSEVSGEIAYVNLPTLIELKLASGISGTDRLKDLADVQELIKLLSLPRDYSHKLNEYVRPKFEELWQNVNGTTRRYVKLVVLDSPIADEQSLDDLLGSSHVLGDEWAGLKNSGVTVERHQTLDDRLWLITTDPEIAKKYDMHEESEFLGSDDI